ncbi:potassium channel protein [Pullulanibacillus camelliae]|uniref:Potassium channel protein n=1 Tax=Pullulanibacillus camelliae TaxID=1707096 RepID=A0A8J2YLB1_9BACL|nr:DUF2922 domain-containing protein [Pullulanibacillus camelliae]GGE51041.1 potassium channel protein [Pullulanibacillus camelliae]
MAKTLELLFENAEGKTVRYALNDPVEPVNEANVNAAMDDIVKQNALSSSGGDLIKKKSARIVERNVTEIELS